MDPLLLIALVVAGLLIGATGTWSPCGFSMIETIGPTGHTGGQPTTLAACATFLPGALAGAVITFGGISLAGAAIPGEAGWASYTVAGAVALVAALAEARGRRIAPQIRRQLPEHWRRIMPMPVAAALYGVLLGLGFTTFVLTFGVWALAGISLALGEPVAGLAIGLGFGVGRAIPIVALAPFAAGAFGRKAITLMAERPELYRAIRFGDAIALVAAAAALLFVGTAQADVKLVKGASDPSAAGSALAYAKGADDAAFVTEGEGPTALPGTDPSISDKYAAVIDGATIRILGRPGFADVASFEAPGVDAVAVSNNWIAYRARVDGRDRLVARKLDDSGVAGEPQRVAAAGAPDQLSLPGIDGNTLVYATLTRKSSRISKVALKRMTRDVVIRSNSSQLSNPSVRGSSLLYVRGTKSRWELRLKRLGNGGFGDILATRSKRIWSTALTANRAYFTVLEGSAPRANISSVSR
ncbi:MAG: hypothetical protein M3331_07850 [Actinomycetota bacterium]|nr:hypothetical protein [Actinomycetota bacterium]